MSSRVKFLLCLTLLALALTGCGRRGPLEPPPGASTEQPAGSVNSTSAMSGDVVVQVPQQQLPPTGSNANPPPSKGQSFLLDPLVK